MPTVMLTPRRWPLTNGRSSSSSVWGLSKLGSSRELMAAGRVARRLGGGVADTELPEPDSVVLFRVERADSRGGMSTFVSILLPFCYLLLPNKKPWRLGSYQGDCREMVAGRGLAGTRRV